MGTDAEGSTTNFEARCREMALGCSTLFEETAQETDRLAQREKLQSLDIMLKIVNEQFRKTLGSIQRRQAERNGSH